MQHSKPPKIKRTEPFGMPNDKPNMSIECSVSQCVHHCTKGNFCSLETVKIGGITNSTTANDTTDCQSFVKKYKC